MILAWLRRFNFWWLEYELAPILTMLTIWRYTGMCMIYFLLQLDPANATNWNIFYTDEF